MSRNKKQNQRKEKRHRINSEVRYPEVRVVGDHGGVVMSSFEASKLAQSEGKDLILITENAKPPVVRIEDYGKYLYNEKKREKERNKNNKRVELKEIKLSVNIAENDMRTKAKHADKFLNDGNKVKCTLQLRGRQNMMKDQGQVVMLEFAKMLEEIGVPESLPKLQGNKWGMVLKPKK